MDPDGRVEVEVRDLPPLELPFQDLEGRREQTAAWLAGGLLVVFAATILAPLCHWLTTGRTPGTEVLAYVKDVAALETTLLGAMVGFYFSQKRLGR